MAIKLDKITPSLQIAAEVSSQDDSMARMVVNVCCLLFDVCCLVFGVCCLVFRLVDEMV